MNEHSEHSCFHSSTNKAVQSSKWQLPKLSSWTTVILLKELHDLSMKTSIAALCTRLTMVNVQTLVVGPFCHENDGSSLVRAGIIRDFHVSWIRGTQTDKSSK